MRVAIANLTNGGLSGGYRKYLGELLPELSAHPSVDELIVTVPAGASIGAPEGVRLLRMARNAHLRGFSTVVDDILKAGPELVFIPTARWRSFGDLPVVTMVRNMEPLSVPFAGNGPLESLRNLGRARAAKVAATKAWRVIAVSESVRDHIVRRWSLDPERVGVVYHGVMPPALPKAAPPPSDRLARLEAEQFFFTAGSIRPARGIEDLIRALAAPTRGELRPRIAVGGRVDWESRFGRRLQKLADDEGVASRVAWLGQLGPQEMSWCFNNCTAFVTTSRAEACPNTLLEAMRHGTLCVATDLDVMKEFLGPDALLYPAGDFAALRTCLGLVLDFTPSQVNRYRSEVRSRAENFTWERTAAETVRQLEKAVTR